MQVITGIFVLTLTVCVILPFSTFDHESLGQDHVIEKRDLRRTIGNINLHKSHTGIFALALTVFEMFIF